MVEKSSQLLDQIFKNAPDNIFLIAKDPEGSFRLISANDSLIKFCSADEVSFVGKKVEELLPKEDVERVSKNYDQVFKTGETMQYEEITNRLSNFHIFDTKLVPIRNETGNISYILGISREITERKQIEEAEKEQRNFTEALLDTASALNSTLDFEELIKKILINAQRVVHSDLSDILLVENGIAKIVYHQGYFERHLQSYVELVQFVVDKTPTLKKMADTGSALIISDVHAFNDWVPFPGLEFVGSYAGAPMIVKNKLIGFLNLNSSKVNDYDQSAAKRLMAFADQAAIAIENARLFKEVQKLAIQDPLTGCFNRRYFKDFGEKEFSRALRYRRPLAVLMADIDFFKNVNDSFGHAAGDFVLVELVSTFIEGLRQEDILCRYGGEEFIALLPETEHFRAARTAERLRKNIAEKNFVFEGKEMSITISIGAATLHHSQDLSLDDLVARADVALYQAKQNGRNKVIS